MIRHANVGRRREALSQYDLLVDTLERELNVTPEPVRRNSLKPSAAVPTANSRLRGRQEGDARTCRRSTRQP